jgi:hypothetical protein
MKMLPKMFVVLVMMLSFSGQALASDTSTTDTSTSNASTSDTSIPAMYDLENEPSQCIGLLPRPGCGKEPEDAGDRGGALQYTVFGLMMLGLGVIGTSVVRGIRKQKPQS